MGLVQRSAAQRTVELPAATVSPCHLVSSRRHGDTVLCQPLHTTNADQAEVREQSDVLWFRAAYA